MDPKDRKLMNDLNNFISNSHLPMLCSFPDEDWGCLEKDIIKFREHIIMADIILIKIKKISRELDFESAIQNLDNNTKNNYEYLNKLNLSE